MSATRGQHLIGKVLGSCVLEKVLGYGGSSAVFLAHQQNSSQKYAIKVFLPRPNMDVQMQKDFYNRFLREAHAASQLDHSNILPIYSYGEQDGLPYIVMPYMSGGTLTEYVAKHGALSFQDAQWYLEQIAAALDYAHAQGCVHCDVKPANILIDDNGHVMLSDFGIAHISRGNTVIQVHAKNPESLMGTPDYISPEQAMGYTLDGRSDIYSLGVTIFYLLAKRLPFLADTSIALALLHVHETPPSLSSLRADSSPALDAVMRTVLAKKPDQRFQTAGAFSAAFTDAVTQIIEANDKLLLSGKRARVLVGSTKCEAVALASLTTVSPTSAKPRRWWPSLTKSPLLGLTSVFLAIMVVALLALNYVIGHYSAKGAPNVQTTISTSINTNPPDLLSNHGGWPSSPPTFFYDDAGRYHILNKIPQDIPLISLYQGNSFSDFQLTVTMEEISNPRNVSNYYGVVFRSAADQSEYYLFEISSAGGTQNGQYVFWRHNGNWTTPALASGQISSLLAGPGKSNMLTINVHGDTFTFSINKKAVGQAVVDKAKTELKSGQIGFFVEEKGAEIAFSNLHVTSLVK